MHDDFPLLSARTRRFGLGVPRDIGIRLYESEVYLRLHQINTMPGSDVVQRRVHPGVWMFGPHQTRIWAEYGVADRQRGHQLGKLHDVPALLSFLGGLAVFGLSGMVLGPAILAVTMAILEVWKRRLVGARARGTAAPL